MQMKYKSSNPIYLFQRVADLQRVLLSTKQPMSDQDRISPHNINTISSRQVIRKEKNINYNSPFCLPYNSQGTTSENLVFYQPMIH